MRRQTNQSSPRQQQKQGTAPTAEDVSKYVSELLRELAKLTRGTGRINLTRLIELAVMEAARPYDPNRPEA